jgi:hypothetical protein
MFPIWQPSLADFGHIPEPASDVPDPYREAIKPLSNLVTTLKGNELKIMHFLVKNGGESPDTLRVPLDGLAKNLGWDKPWDKLWDAARERLNKKLANVGWVLSRHNGQACLHRLDDVRFTAKKPAQRRSKAAVSKPKRKGSGRVGN